MSNIQDYTFGDIISCRKPYEIYPEDISQYIFLASDMDGFFVAKILDHSKTKWLEDYESSDRKPLQIAYIYLKTDEFKDLIATIMPQSPSESVTTTNGKHINEEDEKNIKSLIKDTKSNIPAKLRELIAQLDD